MSDTLPGYVAGLFRIVPGAVLYKARGTELKFSGPDKFGFVERAC